MGLLTKIPLEIKGDRLGLKPFEDILIERHGHHDVYFLCFPFDCDLLIGFVGGDFAWELSAAGEAAAVDFAVQTLARTFGSGYREADRPQRHDRLGRQSLCARRLCGGAAGLCGGAQGP